MNKTIIRNILKVLSVGGAAAGMGAAAIGLLIAAGELFCYVASAVGYLAVVGFLAALVAAFAAFAVVYMCGCWILGTGKFLKR